MGSVLPSASLTAILTAVGVTSVTLLLATFPHYTPSVHDNLDVLTLEVLLSILGDLLGVRVEDVVTALDKSDRDLVLQKLGVVVQHVLLQHVRELSSKLYTGGTTTTDNKGEEMLALLWGRRRQRSSLEVFSS